MNKSTIAALQKLGACSEAIEWLSKQKTVTQAWRDCPDPRWSLWLLGILSGKPESAKRKKLVLCCCEIARLALPYANDKTRPTTVACIEAAEAWARGKATIEQVREARRAAYAAAPAAAYAAYAASAAAAYAASAAAAAAYAAYAVFAADADADAAADAAARSEERKWQADAIRKIVQNPVLKVPK
jgi:hypothetical protein